MTETRAGMVALIGRANVGKSSLMNRILEEKISIVSRVAQTTRNLIRGIHTEERGQIVFLDTPGVHKASYDLGKIMNRTARASVEGVDVAALLFDASERPWKEDAGWIHKLLKMGTPILMVLNKCDLDLSYEKDYRDLYATVLEESGAEKAEGEWMRTSAQTGEGVESFVDRLFDLMPLGPHLFPDDIITDFPRKIAISDVIREKFIVRLKDELPHAIAVRVGDIVEDDHRLTIPADILVNRSSQKGIVIGHKGRVLNRSKKAAEAELSDIYEKKVKLDLWVKVEKHWAKNFWVLRQLGYQ